MLLSVSKMPNRASGDRIQREKIEVNRKRGDSLSRSQEQEQEKA